MRVSSEPRHRWTLTRSHLPGTSLRLTGAPRLVAVYEGDRQLEHGQDYMREGMNLIIFTENPDLISVKELAWHPKTALGRYGQHYILKIENGTWMGRFRNEYVETNDGSSER